MITNPTLTVIADALRATASTVESFIASPEGFRRDADLGQLMRATAEACTETSTLCARSLTVEQIVTLACEAIQKDNDAAAEKVRA